MRRLRTTPRRLTLQTLQSPSAFSSGLVLTLLLLVLPLPAASTADEKILVIPLLAVGGVAQGWHLLTRFSLDNPSDIPQSGSVEFYDRHSRPLHLQVNDESALGVNATWTVPAHESRSIVLSHSIAAFETGWLLLRSSGESPPGVSAVIQLYKGQSLIKELPVHLEPDRNEFIPVGLRHHTRPESGTFAE